MCADSAPFARLLQQQRRTSGLTQATLAARAGLSVRAIQHLEAGVAQPHPDSARRLADALDLTDEGRAEFAAAANPRASTPKPRPAGSRAQALRASTDNLPPQLTSFIGRQAQADAVARRLSESRLLTLTGAGGVGKTRLALEVAARLVPNYPDGVWFVDLAPLAEPMLVAQAVAVAVGVRVGPCQPLGDTLASALAHRQLLLLLDNCEHLVEACAELSDQLLRACPQLRILATSRERLEVGGEVAWRVPSLGLPEHSAGHLQVALIRSEAGQLFVARAAAVKPDFELTEANSPAIARICRVLDGIPMALELAAARISALSPETVAARLDDSLRLLVGGSRTAPQRQQTLEATLDWSYALLPQREQVVLDRLSVFAGSFSLEAAEAVCADDALDTAEIVGTLVRLVDKSLVVAEPAADAIGQYRLLETVRQYAQRRLAIREPDEAAHRRHAMFYLALAERLQPLLWGRDQVLWQGRLERSLDNVRVAARWLIEHGDIWRAQRLGGALADLWPVSSYSVEGRAWMAELLARGSLQAAMGHGEATEPTDGDPTAARAKVLIAFGVLEIFYGDAGSGRDALLECIALCRGSGHWRILTHALFRLAQAARFRGDTAAAYGFALEGAELSRAADDRLEEALNLYVLAGATADRGDPAAAGALAERSLSLFASFGSPRGMGLASLVLGGLRYLQGDPAAARARLEDALAHFRGHLALPEVYALGQLGWLAADEGDVVRARTLFAESLDLEQGLGSVGIFPTALLGAARLVAADHLEDALRLAAAAADLHRGDGGGVDIVPPDLLGIDAWLQMSRRSFDR